VDRRDAERLSAAERNVPLAAPFRIALRSSAAVDRGTHAAAEPHTTACLEFTEGGGLWCVAMFSDDGARERWGGMVRAAFRLLGDSGIGGERSRGWGRFVSRFADQDPFATFNAGEPGTWWLLSLFNPRAEDSVEWDRGDYTISERSGRVENAGIATRIVRMVDEGSVVVAQSAPVGAARDVAPDGYAHPVYRAGFAVAIPVPGGLP
jgi:CRISPR type III-A-associated RAMP protein Csm4